MSTSTLLEELTRGFPDKLRLELREALDRSGIRNPNDPVYELMLVLGIWAKYYESIPAAIETAAEEIRSGHQGALASLDGRLEQLRKLAQAIQTAIDQLDGAPQAIVERFPAESLARTIAAKLDARFQAVPLLKLEKDLQTLRSAVEELTGKDGGSGLAAKVEQGIKRLEESARKLRDCGYVPDRWSRDMLFALFGAAVMGTMIWWGAVRPMREQSARLEEVTRAAYSAGYLTRKAAVGLLEGKPAIRVEGTGLDRLEKARDGTVTLFLKEDAMEHP